MAATDTVEVTERELRNGTKAFTVEHSGRHISDGKFRPGVGASHSLAAGFALGMTEEQHEEICRAARWLFYEEAAVSVTLESGYTVTMDKADRGKEK